MAKNSNLHAAKAAKNDEFYTQLTDIEKEMSHYREHFKGKTIFCNCDDPTWSNFWRYFHLNFGFLGLKKLVATHYDAVCSTYKMTYMGGDDYNIEAGVRENLMQNGDFRSPECIELLRESDIVVTNPPFSLFREYVAQLMEHGKKFIIIGNMNCLTYKEFFPLIKDDIVWPGVNSKGGTRKGNSLCFGVSGSSGLVQVSAWWFTNLDHAKRHEPLTVWRKYYDDPSLYPKYDNYDAINVDKTADIPCDYFQCIGVPISFLDKYNPDQFEIVGCTESEGVGFSNGLFDQRESEAAYGQRQADLQANLHPEKIRIFRFQDGSYKILPQPGLDLEQVAASYKDDGFQYVSGVMGVPISFLDKYCPEQFEIVAFRKGEDGRDLVFTRERERESSTVLSHPCSTAEFGLITGAKQTICSDGKSRYARVAIRRRT